MTENNFGNSSDGTMSDIFLNDIWKFYFHDPSSPDWTLKSYVSLGVVSSVDDFWSVVNPVYPLLSTGMFFMFREHITPVWDDPENIDGGCFSVRVPRGDANDAMMDMLMATIGETLLSEDIRDRWHMVNGVSVSPKNAFSVIKVWLGKGDIPEEQQLWLPSCRTKDVLFSSFREQIQKSKG